MTTISAFLVSDDELNVLLPNIVWSSGCLLQSEKKKNALFLTFKDKQLLKRSTSCVESVIKPLSISKGIARRGWEENSALYGNPLSCHEFDPVSNWVLDSSICWKCGRENSCKFCLCKLLFLLLSAYYLIFCVLDLYIVSHWCQKLHKLNEKGTPLSVF